MAVGPTTFGLLQSCNTATSEHWEPRFLSAPNGLALKHILEVILPSTETPGASDLNLAQFIDAYMQEVAPEAQQKIFKKGAQNFAESFENRFEKDLFEGKPEEFAAIVKEYLTTTPVKNEQQLERTTAKQDPMDKDPEEKMDPETSTLVYLENVREMGIWAWKTSEEMGEHVLWYDPNPGVYIPCGSTEELGNGKAMSL